MLDSDFKLWLLEIYDSCSMNVMACEERGCNHTRNGCRMSLTNLEIKINLQRDSIRLAKHLKNGGKVETRFEGFDKIYPSQVDSKISDGFYFLMSKYGALSKYKSELS